MALLPSACPLWGNAGVRISVRTLGITPTLGILTLLVILLVPIAHELPRRAAFLEGALAEGHLRRSLDEGNATWDPGYDFDDPTAEISCLALILAVIGPPLVFAVAETMELSSLQLVGLALVGLAYLIVRGSVVTQTARLLMFLRLEARLGRPILIEASDGKARPSERESGRAEHRAR
jgi:hypothetical protein